MINIRLKILLTIILASFLVSYSADNNKTPVDVELAKTAAYYYAQQFYGDVRFYSVELAFDFSGNPAVYAFIFYLSNTAPPSLDEIKNNIMLKHQNIKKLRKNISDINQLPISGKDKSLRIDEVKQQILIGEKELSYSDLFVTVYSGATEAHVPVIRCHKGLPNYLTKLPNILENIEGNREISQLRMGNLVYAGIFDHYYALVSSPSLSKSSDIKILTFDSDFLIRLSTGKLERLSNMSSISKTSINQNDYQKEEEREKILREKWFTIKRLFLSNEENKNKNADLFNRIKEVATKVDSNRKHLEETPSGIKLFDIDMMLHDPRRLMKEEMLFDYSPSHLDSAEQKITEKENANAENPGENRNQLEVNERPPAPIVEPH